MNLEILNKLVNSTLWDEAIMPYVNERIGTHINRLVAQEDNDLRGRIKELQAIAQLPEFVKRKKCELGVDKQEKDE